MKLRNPGSARPRWPRYPNPIINWPHGFRCGRESLSHCCGCPLENFPGIPRGGGAGLAARTFRDHAMPERSRCAKPGSLAGGHGGRRSFRLRFPESGLFGQPRQVWPELWGAIGSHGAGRDELYGHEHGGNDRRKFRRCGAGRGKNRHAEQASCGVSGELHGDGRERAGGIRRYESSRVAPAGAVRRMNVTGPSFTSSTCMLAPNRPVATGECFALTQSTK
jgi:hypothetical protein